MKLEFQVCSLELAKRLKELGVKQESLFTWTNFYRFNAWEDEGCPAIAKVENGFEIETGRIVDSYIDDCVKEKSVIPNPGELEQYSAFTVAELGEMLPQQCFSQKMKEKDSTPWVCTFDLGYMKAKDYQYAETEADARAKMLIHLIEKGVVKS